MISDLSSGLLDGRARPFFSEWLDQAAKGTETGAWSQVWAWMIDLFNCQAAAGESSTLTICAGSIRSQTG